ncbi:MAG: RnfABCDGE type electron transport complex subunit D [Clostridia bacterium]|nr:RnfABCDGE type electron transport complex subunit D [Clostridia bacterium]
MNKLVVSSSPHIHTPNNTTRIMLDVIIALLPAAIAGVILFGIDALVVIGICVVTSVLSEMIFNIAVKKEQTVGDLSAVVTGLILGLSLPADATIWWQSIVASVFAIVVVKCLFGGLGCNFANPAATGRIFVFIAFSTSIGRGVLPKIAEVTTSATTLEAIKGGAPEGALPSLFDMFLGLRGGAIGETCILALVIGFVYLVLRGVIYFETPLIYVGTVFVLSLIGYGSLEIALYQILSGAVVYAAVFMITDYVSTPITRTGKMIFAFGCGLITFLIRFYGSYPEGVSFALLIMNILSPYIEKWTMKRPLGGKKA